MIRLGCPLTARFVRPGAPGGLAAGGDLGSRGSARFGREATLRTRGRAGAADEGHAPARPHQLTSGAADEGRASARSHQLTAIASLDARSRELTVGSASVGRSAGVAGTPRSVRPNGHGLSTGEVQVASMDEPAAGSASVGRSAVVAGPPRSARPNGHGLSRGGLLAAGAAAPDVDPSRRPPEAAELSAIVASRIAEHAPELEALAAGAVSSLTTGPGFAILDVGFLFPDRFGPELRAAIERDLPGETRVIVQVGGAKYRVPKKTPLLPGHRDLLLPLFTWAEGIVARAAAIDHPTATPSVAPSMRELRMLGPGSHDPEAERWHRDGSSFTLSMSFDGHSTVIAPVGEYLGDKNYLVDEAQLTSPRPGEMVIMTGGGRGGAVERLGTIHRAPITDDPRLLLIGFVRTAPEPGA